jgi:hypothetical protein
MTENDIPESDEIVIFSDKQKMFRRIDLRFVLIVLPMYVAMFALFAYLRRIVPAEAPSFIKSELTFLPWALIAFYVVIYAIITMSISRQRFPIVTISHEGLNIHTVATQIGLLRWDEIAEVRTYTFIYRYVGIVPRDLNGLSRRVGSGAILLRLNSWCIPLYRLFGIFIAPINIPQEYLPMTADELADRIRAYRSNLPVL